MKKVLSSCLVVMPFLITISILLYCQRSVIERNVRVYSEVDRTSDKRINTNGSSQNFLGGLIPPGTDKKSCLSRFESSLYRKTAPQKPSPYLISKLRSYEERHKRCGPNTEAYNKSIEQLRAGNGQSVGSSDCNYAVYIGCFGLGNRILTTTSIFLYALLTDRVLLTEFGDELSELFCEPFLNTSWLLPHDFPLRNEFGRVDNRFPQNFGNMLRNHKMSLESKDSQSIPSYLYIYVNHDYIPLDKLFFCDDHHSLVKKVPWLLFKANNYFVPSFFLMPSFEEELSKLFPEKGNVFHHLGRYLFSPSNFVWDMVKRYHQAYLAKSDEIIGIQVRTFDWKPGPFEHVMDQIMACTKKEKILPQVVENGSNISHQTGSPKNKAVLVTSLSSGYFEKLKELYWQHPTENGDAVGIYQPSHEESQQTHKHSHNTIAWVEMYLLSLSDVLVTSGWSTFGYVAHGLGGLRPWILPQAVNRVVPNPPCVQVASLEPCFLAPPLFGCNAQSKTETRRMVPHVKHCEDKFWGIKVVDSDVLEPK